MEAGYDYLLVDRPPLLRRFLRDLGRNPLTLSGALLVVLGLVGILVGSLFFFVFDKSTGELEDELVAIAEPATTAGELASGELAQARQPMPTPAQAVNVQQPVDPVAPVAAAVAITELSPDLAQQAGLYPGEALKASYWSDSVAFEPAVKIFCLPGEPECEWQPVSQVAAVGQLQSPTRLIIPSIDVDSNIEQLRILNLGNSSAWETPDNVVGHIPVTANPGEAGSTWLFGHLESPIRDEGNVFAQLPEIPGLIRRGNEDLYAVVENGSESYLYRIVESRVVPQEQLRLTDDGTPQLLMVTCVPRFIYDHRLVVRGVLEGIKS